MEGDHQCISNEVCVLTSYNALMDLLLYFSLKLTDLEKSQHLKKWLDLNSMNYEDVLNLVKIFDHQ